MLQTHQRGLLSRAVPITCKVVLLVASCHPWASWLACLVGHQANQLSISMLCLWPLGVPQWPTSTKIDGHRQSGCWTALGATDETCNCIRWRDTNHFASQPAADQVRSADSSSAAETSEGGIPVITKELSCMATSDAVCANQIASDKPAAVTRPAPMPANDFLQQQATTSSNEHEGSLQRKCQGASTAGMSQASRAVDAAVEPDAVPHIQSASQREADALAAALSSRLASMAPRPSSLCTDTLVVGSKRQHCCHLTREGACHDDVCKRKREERGESVAQLIEKLITRTSPVHTAEPVSSTVHGGVISIVPGSFQSMQDSSQLCQQVLPSQPRKKLRKMSGLEVLYRCMPWLLKNTSQMNS